MTEEVKQKLKIDASIAALTGLLSNPNIIKSVGCDHQEYLDALAIEATCYADTLIAQLEEDEQEYDIEG